MALRVWLGALEQRNPAERREGKLEGTRQQHLKHSVLLPPQIKMAEAW
jgi:hypothetical protein